MYTMRNVNNFKLKDENCYYLQLYNRWLDTQDQETLDELFFIACNVYPEIARCLPANFATKYDIVPAVAEVQKGHVRALETDRKRLTCTGSPVSLHDESKSSIVNVNLPKDNYNYIRGYTSDKETVIKWICETNNVKYYRNHILNEYDMYVGLIAGKIEPLFKVKLLERENKVYAIYVISDDIKKFIEIS